MTAITREFLKALRADINAALAAVASKHGIAIECANGSYDRDGLTGSLKLELATKREGAPEGASATQLRAAADWSKYCAMFGLPADAVGKTIQYGGRSATIVGLLPKRAKFPVLVMRDGKEALFPADAVAAILAREGESNK